MKALGYLSPLGYNVEILLFHRSLIRPTKILAISRSHTQMLETFSKPGTHEYVLYGTGLKEELGQKSKCLAKYGNEG